MNCLKNQEVMYKMNKQDWIDKLQWMHDTKTGTWLSNKCANELLDILTKGEQ